MHLLYTVARDLTLGISGGSSAPSCICECPALSAAAGECPALERLLAQQLATQQQSQQQQQECPAPSLVAGLHLHFGLSLAAFAAGALCCWWFGARRARRSVGVADPVVVIQDCVEDVALPARRSLKGSGKGVIVQA